MVFAQLTSWAFFRSNLPSFQGVGIEGEVLSSHFLQHLEGKEQNLKIIAPSFSTSLEFHVMMYASLDLQL
jgi:hypothetical protein